MVDGGGEKINTCGDSEVPNIWSTTTSLAKNRAAVIWSDSWTRTHTSAQSAAACVRMTKYYRSSCYSHWGLVVNNTKLITKTAGVDPIFSIDKETKMKRGQRTKEAEVWRLADKEEERRDGDQMWPSTGSSRWSYRRFCFELQVAELRQGQARGGSQTMDDVSFCAKRFDHQAALTVCHPGVTPSK